MRCCLALIAVLLFIAPTQAEDAKATPQFRYDLESLQGDWQIGSLYWQIGGKAALPAEAKLNELNTPLKIEGHRLLHSGVTVATLTIGSELPESAPHKSVGWECNRLLLLTLPGGEQCWCSYRVENDKVQITCPASTSCHRGSGQIVYLKRPEQK